MTLPERDFRSMQRAKRRAIRRRVRTIAAILAIVFGSIGLAVLAWQIFVAPYTAGP